MRWPTRPPSQDGGLVRRRSTDLGLRIARSCRAPWREVYRGVTFWTQLHPIRYQTLNVSLLARSPGPHRSFAHRGERHFHMLPISENLTLVRIPPSERTCAATGLQLAGMGDGRRY